jgi:hypothetical protein
MAKFGLLLFSWMRNHAFFHTKRRVSVYGGWIVTGGHLFPLFFFPLVTDKVNLYPFCFLFFNFSLYSFNF